MRPQTRGWIMPEADMLSMLRLSDEKIRSPEIDVRHQDVLIRLRETLENDLEDLRLRRPSDEQYDSGASRRKSEPTFLLLTRRRA
jgi:hypothetical protein